MNFVDCRGCGQPVVARTARCWRCGHPVLDALSTPTPGLNLLAQIAVIGSVFAVVLLGMVVFTQRQQAIDEFATARARAVAVADQQQADADRRAAKAAIDREAPSPTPAPAPDAGGPDTYTVQAGDSLFSVAADLDIGPNELVFWNKDTYPTLQSTPALKAGWVLRTTGPPLPTPTPRPTREPAPPATPEPQIAGPGTPAVPSFGPGSFPASASVSVGYYAVSGSTPQEIHASIQDNGPWSDWLGRNAQAHVQIRSSFNFGFQGDAYGGCSIVSTGGAPVTVTYHVLLPSWTPPAGVTARTVDWWTGTIHETVAHEGHHITLYEAHLPAMNEAVRSGTCASAEADLERMWTDARRANCEFDLAEYGYAVGLTLKSCIAS